MQQFVIKRYVTAVVTDSGVLHQSYQCCVSAYPTGLLRVQYLHSKQQICYNDCENAAQSE